MLVIVQRVTVTDTESTAVFQTGEESIQTWSLVTCTKSSHKGHTRPLSTEPIKSVSLDD